MGREGGTGDRVDRPALPAPPAVRPGFAVYHAVMRARGLTALLVIVAAVVGIAAIARPFARGLSFVVRAVDMHGAVRKLADASVRRPTERPIEIDVSLPTIGTMSGRLYSPAGRPRRMVLLVSGFHPAGIDEPRLVALARELAASGLAVLTPEVPELSRFEIKPSITDRIEAAAVWLSNQASKPDAAAGDGRIGLLGVSFGGGFAVVAAGRASLRDRVAYVLSVGGHDDLARVLRYLCLGAEARPPRQIRLPRATGADGETEQFARRPDDYGVAVVLLAVADRIVPRPQVAALRAAVRRFLEASALERDDQPRAEREIAAQRKLAARLPEPAATLLRYLNDRDVVHLGARLLPYVRAVASDPALSPSRSPKAQAALFLLHGTEDHLIPPLEAEYLADQVRGQTPVRLLLTNVISHAGVDRTPRAGEVLELAGFWGDLLNR
jgi:dienelactone hydrolase